MHVLSMHDLSVFSDHEEYAKMNLSTSLISPITEGLHPSLALHLQVLLVVDVLSRVGRIIHHLLSWKKIFFSTLLHNRT